MTSRARRRGAPSAGEPDRARVVRSRPESFRLAFLWAGLATYVIAQTAIIGVDWIARRLPPRDLTTIVDDGLPLMPAFVWPYLVFWFFPFLPLFITRDWHRYNRLLLAALLSVATASIVFLLVPAVVPRPALGESLSERVLAFSYSLDDHARAANFPSLHTALAWLVVFACRKQGLPRPLDVAIVTTAVLITLATFMTKIHFFVDSVAGILWAIAAWGLAGVLYRRLQIGTESAAQTLRRLIHRATPWGGGRAGR